MNQNRWPPHLASAHYLPNRSLPNVERESNNVQKPSNNRLPENTDYQQLQMITNVPVIRNRFNFKHPTTSGVNITSNMNPQQGHFGAKTSKINILQDVQLNKNTGLNHFHNRRSGIQFSNTSVVEVGAGSNESVKTFQQTPVKFGTTFQQTPIKVGTTFQQTPVKVGTTFQQTPVKVGTNNSDFKPFGTRSGEKLFILTGTVERVIHWNKLLTNHFCYYEVFATVVSLQEGSVRTQKIMLLRDRTGPILQVVYYLLTHLAIENFHLGKMIRCVGKMTGPNILNAFSIRDASQDEIDSLQRLTLISDHAVGCHLKN